MDKEMRLNRSILLYYLILFAIFIFAVKSSTPFGTIYRVAFQVAIILPTLKRIELLPYVILVFFVASRYCFAYTLMFSNLYIYIALTFVVLVLSKHIIKFSTSQLFSILVIVYLLLNNIIHGDKGSELVSNLILLILFSNFIYYERKNTLFYYKLSFIAISFALSFWFLFFDEAKTRVFNVVDGLEQTGWMDPNYYGCVIGMGLIICINELALHRRDKRIPVLLNVGIIILFFIVLIINASRGIIVALSVSIIVLLWKLEIKNINKILIAFLVVLLLYVLYNTSVMDLLIARMSVEDTTASGRTNIWLLKLNYYKNGTISDILFGMGYGQARVIGGKAFHNDFIACLVEYGIVGEFFLLFAFLYPIILVSKPYKHEVVVLIVYLFVCCFSIEPITSGSFASLVFLFFIIQYSRLSKNIRK